MPPIHIPTITPLPSPLSLFFIPLYFSATLYVPPYHSSCMPQLRISGAMFRSVRRLCSDQGDVVTVSVGRQGVKFTVVPISIDNNNIIERSPLPRPTNYALSRASDSPISVLPRDKLDRGTDLLPLAPLLLIFLLSSSSSYLFVNWDEGGEGGRGCCYYPIWCTIPDVRTPSAVPMLWYYPPPQIASPQQCTPLAWFCPFISALNPPQHFPNNEDLSLPITLTPSPPSFSHSSLSLLYLSLCRPPIPPPHLLPMLLLLLLHLRPWPVALSLIPLLLIHLLLSSHPDSHFCPILCWASAKVILKFAQNQISPTSKPRKIIV